MKLLCMLMIAMVVIAGCAKNEVGNVNPQNITATNNANPNVKVEQNAEEPSKEVSTKEKSIEVDKGILNVKVTLPESMFKGQNTDEVIAKAKEDGVGEVTKNDDGSLTYKMTKSKHKEMMKEVESSLLKSIDDMKNSGNFKSIKDVSHNKSYSEYTISVDQKAYKNSFDAFASLGLGITGMYYQLFNGVSVDDYKVTISVKDADTGNVFDTIVYPDALNKLKK
ncbi:hypothetical protein D3C73_528730 [compost metagenome]